MLDPPHMLDERYATSTLRITPYLEVGGTSPISYEWEYVSDGMGGDTNVLIGNVSHINKELKEGLWFTITHYLLLPRHLPLLLPPPSPYHGRRTPHNCGWS